MLSVFISNVGQGKNLDFTIQGNVPFLIISTHTVRVKYTRYSLILINLLHLTDFLCMPSVRVLKTIMIDYPFLENQ